MYSRTATNYLDTLSFDLTPTGDARGIADARNYLMGTVVGSHHIFMDVCTPLALSLPLCLI